MWAISVQLQWELSWYNASWPWETVNVNKYLPERRTIPQRRIYFQWRLVRCPNLATPSLRICYFNCIYLTHAWSSSIPAWSSSRRKQQRTSDFLNSHLPQMCLCVTSLAWLWVFQEALQLHFFLQGAATDSICHYGTLCRRLKPQKNDRPKGMKAEPNTYSYL